MTRTRDDQAPVEQGPQAGANPAAPAGAGAAPPAQDTPAPAADGTPEAANPEAGAASSPGAEPSGEVDLVGDAPPEGDLALRLAAAEQRAAEAEARAAALLASVEALTAQIAADRAGDAGAGPSARLPEATVLIVRGPVLGRWRAGRRFGPEPTALVLADLSAEEVEALRADTSLTVA